MTALDQLLDFCHDTRFDDLPASTVDRAKRAILDTLGVAIAGSTAPALPGLSSLVEHWGGRPEATLLTSGVRVPAPLAALVNATAARAWDLDDLHEANTCHITASLVPALLAACEARAPVSGRELIVAVALGAEIICRLSAAPRIGFTETGSIMSYQCGLYGVALAAGRLLGLSPRAMRDAAGLAHARVAGNQQGFLSGAMAVRVMQGVTAEAGLVCALMAEQGISGGDDVLEGRYGYYRLHHRNLYEPEELTRALGQRFLFDEVSIKPLYPCCRFTHGPIEATLLALEESGIATDEIDEIRVKVTNREARDLVCEPSERKRAPRSVADAQFSLPYLVAAAALHRRVDFDTIEPGRLQDPAVLALIDRVRVELEVDAQGDGRGVFPMPGDVTIVDRDGRTVRREVRFVTGHPRSPMDYGQVARKFLACAQRAKPGWQAGAVLIREVAALETLADAGRLVSMCTQTQTV